LGKAEKKLEIKYFSNKFSSKNLIFQMVGVWRLLISSINVCKENQQID
jgi:hypothetical protein